MRIISGLARGRKLNTPGSKSTAIRPTADRAREALFSILGSSLVSARVLDLFAGTGALGLEAFSRGAKQVVFIEKQKQAIELIRQNCALCTGGMKNIRGNELVVIQHDLCRGLSFQHPILDTLSSFDLIFLDPPYNKNLAEETLLLLDTSTLVNTSTLVVAEESSEKPLPESFSRLAIFDRRRYGDTGFWFYKVKEH